MTPSASGSLVVSSRSWTDWPGVSSVSSPMILPSISAATVSLANRGPMAAATSRGGNGVGKSLFAAVGQPHNDGGHGISRHGKRVDLEDALARDVGVSLHADAGTLQM